MNLELILHHRDYFEAVAKAHTECARRDNLSTCVLKAMHGAKAEDMRSIVTAMMTLETLHGPVRLAREQMMSGEWPSDGQRVEGLIYGFGSSFVRGCPDPALAGCETAKTGVVDRGFMEDGWVDEIPEWIRSASGKPLYPNLAYYTAILCELIQWPDGFEFLLVCMFRSGEWRAILDS